MDQIPVIQSTTIELKDVVTILVSLAALITAISAAIFTRKSNKLQNLEAARKIASEGVVELAKLDREWNTLRSDLGLRSFYSVDNRGRRVGINDQKEFYIAKVLQLIRKHHLKLTHAENLMFASSLIQLGKIKFAVQFYRKSYKTATDRFDKAITKRVYGRALILSGTYKRGRKLMLEAGQDFASLVSDKSYGKSRARREIIETYRRLVVVSLEAHWKDFLVDDFNQLNTSFDTHGKDDQLDISQLEIDQIRERIQCSLIEID